MRVAGALAAAAAVLATALLPSTAGAAVRYAPLSRPGPPLSVPAANLRSALHCEGTLRDSRLEPVLLSPATGATPEQNFSWNYVRAFNAQHRPWCWVTMPYHTLGDIQVAGEYLVYAIRTMHARAQRRIAVVGHSQGGMSMRWALRFWPDTRRMVDDVVGMAGTNHGTTQEHCATGITRCVPAAWQQGSDAHFIAALNSGAETFAGISYTEIYTHTDEVSQPNTTPQNSTSALHTGAGAITNVAIQDVCPGDMQSHLFVGTTDPAAYALVMDALNHPGPARPARIDRAVCRQLVQPGIDPVNLDDYLLPLQAAPWMLSVAIPGVVLVGAPAPLREPRLRCYVYAAGC